MKIRKYLKIGRSTYIMLGVTVFIILIFMFKFYNRYKWEPGKTKFSVFYSSVGTMVQGEINIKVSENGDYEFIEYSRIKQSSDRNVMRKYTGKLTNNEMKELFNYMMNSVNFFKLEEKLDQDNVTDSSFDYLEVNFDGNIHRIGGYAASSDRTFINAYKKLHEINEKFIKNN